MSRYTTRDLMWITVVVALCLAWHMDRRKLERENEAYCDAIIDYAERLRLTVQRVKPVATLQTEILNALAEQDRKGAGNEAVFSHDTEFFDDIDWTILDKPTPYPSPYTCSIPARP
jgi:hypothetical protein